MLAGDGMKQTGLLHPTDVPGISDSVQTAVLAANTGQAFDTPAGAGYLIFAGSVDFYVKYGSTTATVPTTSSTSLTTNSELNPTARNLNSTAACTGISIISALAGVVTLSWYGHT